MKIYKLLFLSLLISFSAFSQESYNANQVIVLITNSHKVMDITQFVNTQHPDLNLNIARTLSKRANIYLLEFDSTQSSVTEVSTYLKADERVKLVQPNHNNVTQRSTIPNDLDYPVQWSLGSTATAKIFAPEAWDISTDGLTIEGDTIVMAVVDGGVDIQHIDLNTFKNKHEIPNNGIDDDQNGYIDDYDGWNAYSQSGVITSDPHGTHIAGIIGANTNNTNGIAGIVWGGKIMPINASSTQESVVIEGYGYILEMRSKYNESNGDSGAFVVASNSSFGIDEGKPADYPIWCAFYDSLGAAGVLNLGATSNSGIDVDARGDIPTTCPSDFMIAVSNINQSGNILGGYGATQIDLAAPGTDIYATLPSQNYGYKTGTSMATPHVTGVIGAMYSAMCGFDFNEVYAKPDSISLWVRQSLLESVDSVPNLIGKNITNGRLNFYKAVSSVLVGKMETTYDITYPSSNTSADGDIQPTIIGGTAPYTYVWSDSSTNSTLSNINPGNYQVSITEKYGCVQNDSIEVWVLGMEKLEAKTGLRISPNPSKGRINLHLQKQTENQLEIKVFNTIGKLVHTEKMPTYSQEFGFNPNLSSGMYILEIQGYQPQIIVIE